MKNKGYEHFFLFKNVGGYNLGSGKQLLAIKVSFSINKPGFWGLMSEIGYSLSFKKADLYDIIFLKIKQLFT